MITLNVLSYNIFASVPEPIRIYGQTVRSQRLKDVIHKLDKEHSLDVIALNEVITPAARTAVERDLPQLGFTHFTKKLATVFSLFGGIYIFSKHPIEHEDFAVFGDTCLGSDCLISKGVVYAQLLVGGTTKVHIFTTHMQAWPSLEAHDIRRQQAEIIRDFIKAQNIPSTEPVLFCGDLNIDMYRDNAHLKHMLYDVHLGLLPMHEDSEIFTVDPKQNQLVGNDNPSAYANSEWPQGCMTQYYQTLECVCCPAEWLDYVLYSKDHLWPEESHSYMRCLKTKVDPFTMNIHASKEVQMQDISDHFPVLGHFEFNTAAPISMFKALPRHVGTVTDAVTKNGMNITIMCFFIASIVLLVLLMALFIHAMVSMTNFKNLRFSLLNSIEK